MQPSRRLGMSWVRELWGWEGKRRDLFRYMHYHSNMTTVQTDSSSRQIQYTARFFLLSTSIFTVGGSVVCAGCIATLQAMDIKGVKGLQKSTDLLTVR